MDIAIASLITSVLKEIIASSSSQLTASRSISTSDLKRIFDQVVEDGEDARIEHREYLNVLGVGNSVTSAKDIWQKLFAQSEIQKHMTNEHRSSIEFLLKKGTLSHRIQNRLRDKTGAEFKPALKQVYGELCQCLADNKFFL